ncbi:MAG TPA: 2-isopropylmalate synthase [Steroidobacteraceae bacterium]|jgi:2-isopropylmalate synthase|nr:2-isopropylmalate synthase [Steroidobacteraceae bacterium]
MLKDPSKKYRPTARVDLPHRQWPSRQLTRVPTWCSTDLRDGNQALFEPMSRETKKRLFKTLCAVGIKEIEVGFPSASDTDFQTFRDLIEQKLIPDDVTIMALTQAREELIRRTVEALRGARRAIVHVYCATAPVWRRVVFNLSVAEVIEVVRKQVELVKQLTDAMPETEWVLEYSPETFSMTELEVSLEACNAAIRAWNAGPGRPIIINLPTTVENATPNVYADQIEWMSTHLERREHVAVSLHTHNDRGTGVAAAELGLLAGADRVEGCLFGNGERSGNVDLVTLALNFYSQGIHPGLDFSDINAVAREVEHATRLPIHPRHPYIGDLVFTAFSGSHQDAIKKGFAAQQPDAPWEVPYIPVDPADLGRTYDSIVRVNSQSGKGGIAYLLERDYGVIMPRRMQVEFSALVQRHMDAAETEMSAQQLWSLFESTYLATDLDMAYHAHHLFEEGDKQGIEIEMTVAGHRRKLRGIGSGPIAATVNALALPIRIDNYEERALRAGADASALAIVEAARDGINGVRYGAGRHANIATASVLAVLSAARRLGVSARDLAA